MDPISHLLAGYTVSKALNINNLNVEAVLLFSSIAVDWDVVYWFKGNIPYFKNHRGFSHSVGGFLILSMAISLTSKIIFPSIALKTLIFASLCGIITHVTFDLMTTYGTRLLLPFSKKWYALDLIPGFDFFIFSSWLLLLFIKRNKQLLAILILIFNIFFLFLRFLFKTKAKTIIINNYLKNYKNIKRIQLFPYPFTPLTWMVLVEVEDMILRGVFNFILSKKFKWKIFRQQIPISLISKLKNSELFNHYFNYARFPWGYIENQNGLKKLIWQDMRFKYFLRRKSFCLTLTIDNYGNIKEEKYFY